MKNLLLALNIVLVGAVGFLFFKNYSKPGETRLPGYSKGDSILPFKNRIAYFSLDSLESLEYYKEKKAEIDKLQNSGNASLESAQKNYTSRLTYYNQQLSQNPTPELEAKAKNELMGLQEDMEKKKRDLDTKLFEKGNEVKDEIRKSIQNYLKEYNKGKGFSYIMSDEPGLIFYKDSALNITADLVNGLNQLHKKTKQ